MIHDLLPVTIQNIIKNEELEISYLNLVDVQGFLYKKNIGINKNLDLYKTRFAIAHEIGHYMNGDTLSFPFFDRVSEEIADNFAITVLLPERQLLEQGEKHEWDLTILEKVFGVEMKVIEKRLKQIFNIK